MCDFLLVARPTVPRAIKSVCTFTSSMISRMLPSRVRISFQPCAASMVSKGMHVYLDRRTYSRISQCNMIHGAQNALSIAYAMHRVLLPRLQALLWHHTVVH